MIKIKLDTAKLDNLLQSHHKSFRLTPPFRLTPVPGRTLTSFCNLSIKKVWHKMRYICNPTCRGQLPVDRKLFSLVGMMDMNPL